VSANQKMSLKELVEAVKSADLEILFEENWIDCLYGMPGTGKSMLIALMAMWLHIHKKQKTRWIVGDGGFRTVQNLGLVQIGAVESCEYSHRPEPATTIELLCEGYWPGKTLIPGTQFTKLEPTSPDVMKNIGLYVIEGFGVAANYIMSNVQGGLAQRAASGEKLGVEAVSRFADAVDVGGGKRNHGTQTGWAPYNHATTVLMGCKRRSEALGHVIWTTHERDGEDKVNNDEKWIGPEVAGKALTTKLAGMFGNTFHTVQVQKKTQGVDSHSGAKVHKVDTIRRVYTSNHFDAEGQVQRQYVGNCRTYGMEEYYDLVTPADGLKLWSDLARLKREAKEALEALSA
jgi:hypothetical protein